MKNFYWIGLLSILVALKITPTIAQNESDERALLEVQNGISISKDSLFKLNLRFRMQNRFGMRSESGEDLSIEQTDFRVRRMRLRLDGYVLNPRIQYYIQLGFSKSDMASLFIRTFCIACEVLLMSFGFGLHRVERVLPGVVGVVGIVGVDGVMWPRCRR